MQQNVCICVCVHLLHMCVCLCVQYALCEHDASSSLRSDSKAVQKPLWLALDEIQVHVTKSSRGTAVPM